MNNTKADISVAPGCGCAAVILALVIAWNFNAILGCFDRGSNLEDLRKRVEVLEKKISPQGKEYLKGVSFPEISEATQEVER